MARPAGLNIPSASGSKLAQCLTGITLADAKGFDWVRVGGGLSNVPFSNATQFDTVDVSGVTSAVTAAMTAGIGIDILINCGIKRSQAVANAFNGGVLWPVPNLPWEGCTTALKNWICDVPIQQIVNAARAAVLAFNPSANPALILRFELLNEPGYGGNQAPRDADGTFTTYGAQAGGTIVDDYARFINLVLTRVNFYGIPVVPVNLEGQQGSDQAQEVASLNGFSLWQDIISANDWVSTNCYGPEVDSPYSAGAWRSKYETKIDTQIDLLETINGYTTQSVRIGEYGLHRDRCLTCLHPNSARQAIVDGLTYVIGAIAICDRVDVAALYTAYNWGDNPASVDFNYYAWESNGTPLSVNGSQVDILAPEDIIP